MSNVRSVTVSRGGGVQRALVFLASDVSTCFMSSSIEDLLGGVPPDKCPELSKLMGLCLKVIAAGAKHHTGSLAAMPPFAPAAGPLLDIQRSPVVDHSIEQTFLWHCKVPGEERPCVGVQCHIFFANQHRHFLFEKTRSEKRLVGGIGHQVMTRIV